MDSNSFSDPTWMCHLGEINHSVPQFLYPVCGDYSSAYLLRRCKNEGNCVYSASYSARSRAPVTWSLLSVHVLSLAAFRFHIVGRAHSKTNKGHVICSCHVV